MPGYQFERESDREAEGGSERERKEWQRGGSRKMRDEGVFRQAGLD